MQSFGATLKFYPHFLCLMGWKTSRACTCMLSSENDDFKLSKKLRKEKARALRAPYSSRARGTVLSLQTSMSLTRNMNVKVATELYYKFFKISKFKYL